MCLHKGGIAALCTCRGGKSSIQKVVFHKLSPNETLFLESTSKVVKDDISNSSFVQFQVSGPSQGVHRMALMACFCCRFGTFRDR